MLDSLDPAGARRARQRPDYLDRRSRADASATSAIPTPCAARSTASTPCTTSRRGSASARACTRSREYTSVNNLGTAVLLEALIERPVQRLVVASSMSIYGEGLLSRRRTATSRRRRAHARAARVRATGSPRDARRRARCEPRADARDEAADARVGLRAVEVRPGAPLPDHRRAPTSIPTVALRFFNVYGPRQALSNPYTGVLAIFASRLLNDKPPLLFEDGRQRRDFVSVSDVARGLPAGARAPRRGRRGVQHRQRPRVHGARRGRAAGAASSASDIEPEITGTYRVGDIRHCFADISAATARLGYQPRDRARATASSSSPTGSRSGAEDRVPDRGARARARGLTV